MKNWKHFTVLAILAVFGIVFTFTSCDNGNNGIETFTVTFDADNGSTNTTQTVTKGGKAIKPTDPTKNGFDFVYWFNTATDSEWDFNMAITADINLKAKWEVAVCTCPEGTTHEPDEICCAGIDCECPIAEPAVRDFSVSFDFPYSDGEKFLCNATVQDVRTQSGSKTLEDLDIVIQIAEEIMGAFNTVATSNLQKNRFRNVFGAEGGVTIIVDNTAVPYKMKATDASTMYFHVDYLMGNPVDIQQNVLSTVTAMNSSSTIFPFEVE